MGDTLFAGFAAAGAVSFGGAARGLMIITSFDLLAAFALLFAPAATGATLAFAAVASVRRAETAARREEPAMNVELAGSRARFAIIIVMKSCNVAV